MRRFAKGFLDSGLWLSVVMTALALIDDSAVGQCQLVKILASDGAAIDYFGQSVSISGTPGNEVAIVGAYEDDDNGTDSGSAYVYRFNGVNWVEEQKLLASDGAVSDFFGFSVSIHGNIALVGAYQHPSNGSSTGSVYIYHFNPNTSGWDEGQELRASDGAAGDVFGISVSISGAPGNEVAITGAWGDDDNGSRSGSAYIFGCLPDCNNNGIDDADDIVSGFSNDFNDNGVPDECDPDCNVNGLPDFIDIAFDLSDDCNLNAVPDECDLSDGTSFDCNGNSVLDECDIATLFSDDLNLNGIPDECECPGDISGNLVVNVTDLLLLLEAWGPNPGHNADIDGDGDVNVIDLLILLADWGSVCT